MILTLTRDYSGADCTLGRLAVGPLTFDTIERPWVEDPAGRACGEPNLSCVPAGIYQLHLHDTAAHPHTFALENRDLDVCADPIPGMRSDCLIHSANWAWQLCGCIAPGLTRIRSDTAWMVTDSREAMARIQALVPWVSGHILEVP